MGDFLVQRAHIRARWSEISDKFNVPTHLFDHQADTISLVLSKEHLMAALPTGSGKTLPQLAAVLFTEGLALVIPPLITIEKQMCDVCDQWNIEYLNLSSLSDPKDIEVEIEVKKPHIIIASIEKISDALVQKALMNVKFEYISVDEAQVKSY